MGKRRRIQTLENFNFEDHDFEEYASPTQLTLNLRPKKVDTVKVKEFLDRQNGLNGKSTAMKSEIGAYNEAVAPAEKQMLGIKKRSGSIGLARKGAFVNNLRTRMNMQSSMGLEEQNNSNHNSLIDNTKSSIRSVTACGFRRRKSVLTVASRNDPCPFRTTTASNVELAKTAGEAKIANDQK